MKRWQQTLAISFLALMTAMAFSGCSNRVVNPRPLRSSRPAVRQPTPTLAPNPARTPLKAPTEFDQIENVPADSILRQR